jgi:hypothetical protein
MWRPGAAGHCGLKSGLPNANCRLPIDKEELTFNRQLGIGNLLVADCGLKRDSEVM